MEHLFASACMSSRINTHIYSQLVVIFNLDNSICLLVINRVNRLWLTCIVKRWYLLEQSQLKQVKIQMSNIFRHMFHVYWAMYLSENASTQHGLVGTRTNTHGCSPWPLLTTQVLYQTKRTDVHTVGPRLGLTTSGIMWSQSCIKVILEMEIGVKVNLMRDAPSHPPNLTCWGHVQDMSVI
jgi:hypothetical protein